MPDDIFGDEGVFGTGSEDIFGGQGVFGGEGVLGDTAAVNAVSAIVDNAGTDAMSNMNSGWQNNINTWADKNIQQFTQQDLRDSITNSSNILKNFGEQALNVGRTLDINSGLEFTPMVNKWAEQNILQPDLQNMVMDNREDINNYFSNFNESALNAGNDLNQLGLDTVNQLKDNAWAALNLAQTPAQVQSISNMFIGTNGLIPLATNIHNDALNALNNAVNTKVTGITSITNTLLSSATHAGIYYDAQGNMIDTTKNTIIPNPANPSAFLTSTKGPQGQQLTIDLTREYIPQQQQLKIQQLPAATVPTPTPTPTPTPEDFLKTLTTPTPKLEMGGNGKGEGFSVVISAGKDTPGLISGTYYYDTIEQAQKAADNAKQYFSTVTPKTTEGNYVTSATVQILAPPGRGYENLELSYDVLGAVSKGMSPAASVPTQEGKIVPINAQTNQYEIKAGLPITYVTHETAQLMATTQAAQPIAALMAHPTASAIMSMSQILSPTTMPTLSNLVSQVKATTPAAVEAPKVNVAQGLLEASSIPSWAANGLQALGNLLIDQNKALVANGLVTEKTTVGGELGDHSALDALMHVGNFLSNVANGAPTDQAWHDTVTKEIKTTTVPTDLGIKVADYGAAMTTLGKRNEINLPAVGIMSQEQLDNVILNYADKNLLSSILINNPKQVAMWAYDPRTSAMATERFGTEGIAYAQGQYTPTRDDIETINTGLQVQGLGQLTSGTIGVTGNPVVDMLIAPVTVFGVGGEKLTVETGKEIAGAILHAGEGMDYLKGIQIAGDVGSGISDLSKIQSALDKANELGKSFAGMTIKIPEFTGSVSDAIGSALIKSSPVADVSMIMAGNVGDVAKALAPKLDEAALKAATVDIGNKINIVREGGTDSPIALMNVADAFKVNPDITTAALAEMKITDPTGVNALLGSWANTPGIGSDTANTILRSVNEFTANGATELSKAIGAASDPIAATTDLMERIGSTPTITLAAKATEQAMLTGDSEGFKLAQAIETMNNEAAGKTLEALTIGPSEERQGWISVVNRNDALKQIQVRDMVIPSDKITAVNNVQVIDKDIANTLHVGDVIANKDTGEKLIITSMEEQALPTIKTSELGQTQVQGFKSWEYTPVSTTNFEKTGIIKTEVAPATIVNLPKADVSIAEKRVLSFTDKPITTPIDPESFAWTNPGDIVRNKADGSLYKVVSKDADGTIRVLPASSAEVDTEVRKIMATKLSETPTGTTLGKETSELPTAKTPTEAYAAPEQGPTVTKSTQKLATSADVYQALVDKEVLKGVGEAQKNLIDRIITTGIASQDELASLSVIKGTLPKESADMIDSALKFNGVKLKEGVAGTQVLEADTAKALDELGLTYHGGPVQEMKVPQVSQNVELKPFEPTTKETIPTATTPTPPTPPIPSTTPEIKPFELTPVKITPTSVSSAIQDIAKGNINNAVNVLGQVKDIKILDLAAKTTPDMMTGIRAVDITGLKSIGLQEDTVNALMELRSNQALKELGAMGDIGKSIAGKTMMGDKLTTEELKYALSTPETIQTVVDARWTKGGREIMSEANADIIERMNAGKLTREDALKELDELDSKDPIVRDAVCG